MAPQKEQERKEAKNKAERFRRRMPNTFKKGFELVELFGADMALFIHHRGRIYVGTSEGDLSWIPTKETMVIVTVFWPRHDAYCLIGAHIPTPQGFFAMRL
jgi:hypothetical protein